jgi:hypothetical protein
LRVEGVALSAQRILVAVNLRFSDRNNNNSIQFNSIQFINMLTLQPEGQLQSEHGAETENT